MKVLFCIWGQIRAHKTSGENYQKYLFNNNNYENDLLIFCNCTSTEDISLTKKKALSYGKTMETIIYHKDIKNIRDEINMHTRFNNNNINNIFSDSSLQMLYNGHLLKKFLETKDLTNYDYIILLRSDTYFVQPINILHLLSPNFIYTYKGFGGGNFFSGKWLTPAIIPKNLIMPFLNSHSINIFKYSINGSNIESCIYNNLLQNNIKFSFIDINIAFITADDQNEITTWGPVEYDANKKMFFKYGDIYYDAINHIEQNIMYKNVNNVIMCKYD
jgi:hypothetical protein